MQKLRQVLFLIFCLTLIFTLTGQTTFPQTYYITGRTVNARSCPQTTCSRVASLTRGTAIIVEGTETGTIVSRSNLWLRFDYEGTTAYVHSSLASTRTPTTNSSITTGGTTGNSVISTPVPSSGSVTCNGATTCSQMNSCDQAYACLRAGRDSLDRDNDGVPCESICPGG